MINQFKWIEEDLKVIQINLENSFISRLFRMLINPKIELNSHGLSQWAIVQCIAVIIMMMIVYMLMDIFL